MEALKMTLGVLFRSLGFSRNECKKIILNQFNHLAMESDLSVRNTIHSGHIANNALIARVSIEQEKSITANYAYGRVRPCQQTRQKLGRNEIVQ